MSNQKNLIQNIQTLSRIAFRRGTHLEAMFWEASKFNAPHFDQAVFATGLSKLLQLLLVNIGAELAGWKIQLFSSSRLIFVLVTTNMFFFYWIKLIKCCSLDPYIHPQNFHRGEDRVKTQNGGGLLWSQVHIEKSHTICVTES